jgi:Icc-related predicted phosphoesterase
VIRIAAVADIHAGPESAGMLAPLLGGLRQEADLFLLAGDLTRAGNPSEAEILVDELAEAGVPIVAVLGNHDHHHDQAPAIVAILNAAGIDVLDRSGIVREIAGQRVAIAGTKGFGGGFGAALVEDVGEREMKSWIHHAASEAAALEDALSPLVADIRLVLLHYAPTPETLDGERLELYPFLGNSMLGEAIDRAGADLVLHGHAHRGSPVGATPGGVPVRNVAQPVIRRPYALFTIERGDESRPQRGLRRRLQETDAVVPDRARGKRARWLRRATRVDDRDTPRDHL